MDRFREPDYRDEPKVICDCEDCGTEIYKGQDVVKHDGMYFCDIDCVINWLDVCYITAE